MLKVHSAEGKPEKTGPKKHQPEYTQASKQAGLEQGVQGTREMLEIQTIHWLTNNNTG